MKLHTIVASFLLYIMAAICGQTAMAELAAENSQSATILLSEVAPAKNAQSIIAMAAQQMPDVKKEPFPESNKLYKKLTGYTADSMTDSNFNLAYKKALRNLPAEARENNKWIERLEYATTMPNEFYQTPLGGVVSMSACEPHNCPNNLKMIYEPNKRKLWGLLHDETKKKNYLLGEPTDEQLALLLVVMGNGLTLN